MYKYLLFILISIVSYVEFCYGNTRIYLAETANPGEFPYAVLILGRTQRELVNCTGSILTKDWVLTARMCTKYDNGTKKLRPQDFSIYAGYNTYEINEINEFRRKGVVQIETKNIQYKKHQAIAEAGIAIMRVSESFSMSVYIRPVALRRTTPVNRWVRCIGIGFGGDWPSNEARNLTKTCDDMCFHPCEAVPYRFVKERFGHNPSFYCPRAKCTIKYMIVNGDEGAPMVCIDGDGSKVENHRVCGLAYFGLVLRKQHGNLMIYMTLDRYIEWINKHITDLVLREQ